PPANYVSIPDTNFGTWLNANGFSACLIGNNSAGWLMDTTCPAVTSTKAVFINNEHVYDVTGIQYFDSLTYFGAFACHLTSLPPLPHMLTTLLCDYNQITSLPALPAGLKLLGCDNNHLTSLPTLPPALDELRCRNNRLTSLPALPASLNDL